MMNKRDYNPNFHSSLETIREIVQSVFGVENISKRTRDRYHSDSRRVYCALAREFTDKSMHIIGASIDRDHSTVVHNMKTVYLITNDKDLQPLHEQARILCKRLFK